MCAEDLALVIGPLPCELVIHFRGVQTFLDSLRLAMTHRAIIDEITGFDSRSFGAYIPLPSFDSGVDVDHADGASLADLCLRAPKLSQRSSISKATAEFLVEPGLTVQEVGKLGVCCCAPQPGKDAEDDFPHL